MPLYINGIFIYSLPSKRGLKPFSRSEKWVSVVRANVAYLYIECFFPEKTLLDCYCSQ